MIERLSELPALATVPRDQLQWLLDHGEVRQCDDGSRFFGTADETGLLLLVAGRFSVRVNQGGVEREVREVTAGRVTGYLPYSRMTAPRGYLVADGPVEFVRIRPEDLREMTRACYEFTALCVHEMLDRVRDFKSDDKRQEKMAALGRLSAGLAHELNNPTSAATRAAHESDAARTELVTAARALGGASLSGKSLEALQALEAVIARPASKPLSPLDRAELGDQVTDWLNERGIDSELAYPLIERGLTVTDLEAAALAMNAGQLAGVLRYLAADSILRGLHDDVKSATARIHSLVAAVKKHTHMDRAPTTEPTRLNEHLVDAVTLMRAKAELKKVTVALRLDGELSVMEASVAELNQVWMQLLDNAIDAVGESGRITIEASRDADVVVVRVIDDGPGVPPDLTEKIFDPFFTTKAVGEGRGLGLDIVRTVVLSHRGSIHLASVPGRTEFRVALPASGSEARSG